MIISAAKASEAADVLEVELNSLTSSALGKAYRQKAKECHPDHHGPDKLSTWARVDWANSALKNWLEQHPDPHPSQEITNTGDCRACGGTGRIKVSPKGFGTGLTMQCMMCKGLGTVIPEENDSE